MHNVRSIQQLHDPRQANCVGCVAGPSGGVWAQPQAGVVVLVGDGRVRWGGDDGAPLQSWGVAARSPRLSSWSPLGTRGFGDGAMRRGLGICRSVDEKNGARTFQSVSGVRRGLGVGGSGGPTARGHTSLGARNGLAFCREIVRYCEALAPLQGALIGVVGYLGHRGAQPQAVLLVPVGDARVRWGIDDGAPLQSWGVAWVQP